MKKGKKRGEVWLCLLRYKFVGAEVLHVLVRACVGRNREREWS